MQGRALSDFIEEVSGESHLRVEHDFGDGYVRLCTSEAERRQAAQDIQCSENILLEMMRNSKDAHGSRIFAALAKEGAKRTITVIDNGDGIPQAMHRHIFEPRVTSKLDTSHKDAWGLHGRGMALYSIAQNAEEARVVCSEEGKGSALQAITDTLALPERSDQSSFPTFALNEKGEVAVRGPRNLLRCACEFAIEARDSCTVCVGSPAEVASALWAYGNAALTPASRIFCKDPGELPLIKRLATAEDPAAFAELAAGLGLGLSERTARRIMDGQVKPALPLLEQISIEDPRTARAPRGKRGAGRRRAVSLTPADRELLASGARDAFGAIAPDYYLQGDVQPSVAVGARSLTITIPLIPSA